VRELLMLLQWSAAATSHADWSLNLVEPLLSKLPESFRHDTLKLVLEVFTSADDRLSGVVRLVSTSVLKIVENPFLLRIALAAKLRGLSVSVLTADSQGAATAFNLTVSGTSGGLAVSAGQREASSGAAWTVEAWSGRDATSSPDWVDRSNRNLRAVPVTIPDTPQSSALADAADNETAGEKSVTDLFGDLIALRDLQPRTHQVRALDQLRVPLDLAAPFVPRKSELDYARVVRSFVDDLVGQTARIIYVGDTIFNDGSVICNLESNKPDSVFGFLCNEKGFATVDDFILGPIYFAKRWRSLVPFARECQKRGIPIDANTVGLFDLDQTVYAAKGRDDGPLHQARWDAIQAFLKNTIPAYKFEPEAAERIYRQFDRDEYHRITRDNMDYVVLLVLAVAAGLCDAREIDSFAASSENSISSLTELLHARALARRGHEQIDDVLEVIRAVHYNTLAGDQTPCKDFRQYECHFTALRMRSQQDGDGAGRIVLNREVVDFVHFLKEKGARVFAVSDRPVEAAVIEQDYQRDTEDLMSIPMPIIGVPIANALKNIR
jgi:hypothetical protein